jgi:prevent-host-death family protein
MNLDRDIHSLTDFKKNTPDYLKQLKDTGEPVVLTINGKAELVVQDAASYQKLLDIADQAKVLEGIRRGLEDMRAGRTQPVDEAFADIRRDLKLPQGS